MSLFLISEELNIINNINERNEMIINNKIKKLFKFKWYNENISQYFWKHKKVRFQYNIIII